MRTRDKTQVNALRASSLYRNVKSLKNKTDIPKQKTSFFFALKNPNKQQSIFVS